MFALSGLQWNLFADVRALFGEHFMVNALIAGTIVALMAGAVGWFMVLRRQAFAGHTLSVVTFPGAAGAIYLGINATFGYFAAAILAALVIAGAPGAGSGRPHATQSAVIGTVQAFALATGALFVSLYGGFLNGVSALLFGSFLGISNVQVIVLAGVAAVTLAALGAMSRPLFFATIDPDVAAAHGVPVRMLSFSYLVLLGCAAAEVVQITGALLVFALLVMPAAAAQQLSTRPMTSFVLTLAFGLIVSWFGLAAAYFSIYPVGFFVTTFGIMVYSLSVATRLTRERTGRSALARFEAGA